MAAEGIEATLAALKALLADNFVSDISAQDLRAVLESWALGWASLSADGTFNWVLTAGGSIPFADGGGGDLTPTQQGSVSANPVNGALSVTVPGLYLVGYSLQSRAFVDPGVLNFPIEFEILSEELGVLPHSTHKFTFPAVGTTERMYTTHMQLVYLSTAGTLILRGSHGQVVDITLSETRGYFFTKRIGGDPLV